MIKQKNQYIGYKKRNIIHQLLEEYERYSDSQRYSGYSERSSRWNHQRNDGSRNR